MAVSFTKFADTRFVNCNLAVPVTLDLEGLELFWNVGGTCGVECGFDPKSIRSENVRVTKWGFMEVRFLRISIFPVFCGRDVVLLTVIY